MRDLLLGIIRMQSKEQVCSGNRLEVQSSSRAQEYICSRAFKIKAEAQIKPDGGHFDVVHGL